MVIIADQKRELRKYMQSKRQNMSSRFRHEESTALIDMVSGSNFFRSAKNILVFWPLLDEPDLRPLYTSFALEKRFYLPTVVGKSLEIRFFEGVDKMVKGNHFGILESAGELLEDLSLIDMVLVPGVAFDMSGGRLGRGGGYYDKIIPQLSGATLFGTGFSFQLVDNVPREHFDALVDHLFIPGMKNID
ncbi:5-formyltetrahydrofolate cyclo-ligase [Marinilabiliaceae bacterium ANBcel2]|nr:5-formyltetrahydrofolate cyclo-ligase [Marinilabiliaceae bacterium ANBcel2]